MRSLHANSGNKVAVGRQSLSDALEWIACRSSADARSAGDVGKAAVLKHQPLSVPIRELQPAANGN
jgi:hypothetical protein